MINPINGWTKQSIIKYIIKNFKGKAMDSTGTCLYLTEDNKKCAVGLFIPDNHPGQEFKGDAFDLFEEYPELLDKMPLTKKSMQKFQNEHDSLDPSLPIATQLACLVSWLSSNVKD